MFPGSAERQTPRDIDGRLRLLVAERFRRCPRPDIPLLRSGRVSLLPRPHTRSLKRLMVIGQSGRGSVTEALVCDARPSRRGMALETLLSGRSDTTALTQVHETASRESLHVGDKARPAQRTGSKLLHRTSRDARSGISERCDRSSPCTVGTRLRIPSTRTALHEGREPRAGRP